MNEDAMMIKVAALIRQKQIGNARNLLQEFVAQNSSGKIPATIQLVFAQLQLMENQLSAALESLRRLGNETIKHQPGMVKMPRIFLLKFLSVSNF